MLAMIPSLLLRSSKIFETAAILKLRLSTTIAVVTGNGFEVEKPAL
jgi:hypothetical protein